MNTKKLLQELYRENTRRATRFRFGMLAFDLVTILFFVVSSMFDTSLWLFIADCLIAAVIAADVTARATLEQSKRQWLLKLDTWMDLMAIVSLLAALFINNASFLRVVRTLRLLRSYHVMRDIQKYWPWFRAHQDVIESSFNLFVFIYFITAVVYVTQHGVNPDIKNYVDALYFTVTTLTTTGFGDITMKDTVGRMLSVLIMIVGVSLFLRLVQTIFRPEKVNYKCPDCGLKRHDNDAVHCKHCGRVLDIENEGY